MMRMVDRFMKLDYHRQLARIKALGTRFGVGPVVACQRSCNYHFESSLTRRERLNGRR